MDWQGLSARTDLTRYALSADLRRRRAATTLLTRLTSSPQAAKVLGLQRVFRYWFNDSEVL